MTAEGNLGIHFIYQQPSWVAAFCRFVLFSAGSIDFLNSINIMWLKICVWFPYSYRHFNITIWQKNLHMYSLICCCMLSCIFWDAILWLSCRGYGFQVSCVCHLTAQSVMVIFHIPHTSSMHEGSMGVIWSTTGFKGTTIFITPHTSPDYNCWSLITWHMLVNLWHYRPWTQSPWYYGCGWPGPYHWGVRASAPTMFSKPVRPYTSIVPGHCMGSPPMQWPHIPNVAGFPHVSCNVVLHYWCPCDMVLG